MILTHDVLPRGYNVQDGITTSDGKMFSASASANLLFDIAYNGGPFMAGKVNLYNIYFGSTNTKDLLDYFAANIGNSSWYTTMKHYSGGGQTVSGAATLASSKYVSTTTKTLTDSSIRSTIAGLFFARTLTADPNGIYAFIFKGDIAYSGWLTEWCGYHSYFTYNGVTIKYFVAGDSSFSANGAACQGYQNGATANNNIGADSLASVYAHELVATVSDYSGKAFYATTSDGMQENGDLCAWSWGSFLPGSVNANVVVGKKNFLIQQNWLPGVGCVLNDADISSAPTESPTTEMSVAPTESPSNSPIYTPTETPSSPPNFEPSEAPTTASPGSASPTEVPTTGSPVTASPTEVPTTGSPVTASPSEFPFFSAPTEVPSVASLTEVPSVAAPTEIPSTDPTFVQSSAPTAVPSAPFPTLRVPSYSAINTFSATQRTVPYNFTACSGILLKISDCDPSRCFSGKRSSDQFIRLYNSTKSQVAFNDDSCSTCSTIYYTTQGPCQLYTLQQGCYMNRYCTGKFSIQMISAPTVKPTMAPTIVTTVEPSISFKPTSSNTLACPFSTPVLSRRDLLDSGVTCGPFQFCPGMRITIQDNSPFCQGQINTKHYNDRGKNFAELIAVYDSNGNTPYDSKIKYSSYSSSAPCQSATISSYSSKEWWWWAGGGSCKQYTLYMGCGSSTCSTNGGQYTITTTITPTAAPTVRTTRRRGRDDDEDEHEDEDD